MAQRNEINTPSECPDRAGPNKSAVPAIPIISSEALLRGNREVHIIHGDEVYRLVLTKNNKLILQK